VPPGKNLALIDSITRKEMLPGTEKSTGPAAGVFNFLKFKPKKKAQAYFFGTISIQ
jgi:hypothetical protein